MFVASEALALSADNPIRADTITRWESPHDMLELPAAARHCILHSIVTVLRTQGIAVNLF